MMLFIPSLWKITRTKCKNMPTWFFNLLWLGSFTFMATFCALFWEKHAWQIVYDLSLLSSKSCLLHPIVSPCILVELHFFLEFDSKVNNDLSILCQLSHAKLHRSWCISAKKLYPWKSLKWGCTIIKRAKASWKHSPITYDCRKYLVNNGNFCMQGWIQRHGLATAKLNWWKRQREHHWERMTRGSWISYVEGMRMKRYLQEALQSSRKMTLFDPRSPIFVFAWRW